MCVFLNSLADHALLRRKHVWGTPFVYPPPPATLAAPLYSGEEDGADDGGGTCDDIDDALDLNLNSRSSKGHDRLSASDGGHTEEEGEGSNMLMMSMISPSVSANLWREECERVSASLLLAKTTGGGVDTFVPGDWRSHIHRVTSFSHRVGGAATDGGAGAAGEESMVLESTVQLHRMLSEDLGRIRRAEAMLDTQVMSSEEKRAQYKPDRQVSCGVVYCGVVSCDVMWSGVVSCGGVSCGVVSCRVV